MCAPVRVFFYLFIFISLGFIGDGYLTAAATRWHRIRISSPVSVNVSQGSAVLMLPLEAQMQRPGGHFQLDRCPDLFVED